MLRNKKVISILLVLFIIMQPFKAAAKPQNTVHPMAEFKVSADISEIPDFDGIIYVYIYDSRDKIQVFGLEPKNNFSSTYELPTGEATLYKVMIRDNKGTELRMNYTTEGSWNIREDTKENNINFKIQNGLEEDNNITEDNEEESSKEKKEKSEEESNKEKKRKAEEEEKEKSRNKRRIINFIIDIVLISLFSVILVYIKYKDKKREKESGEK